MSRWGLLTRRNAIDARVERDRCGIVHGVAGRSFRMLGLRPSRGQLYRELRAGTGLRLHFDVATHHHAEPAAERKSKSGAAMVALRRGKAIIVSPLVNAGAPLLTAVISLALTGVAPGPLKLVGIALALVAALLLALQSEEPVQA